MRNLATQRLYDLICSLLDESKEEGDERSIRDKKNHIEGWNADIRDGIKKLFASSGLAKDANYTDCIIDVTATTTITFTQAQVFHTYSNVNNEDYGWDPEIIEYNKDRITVNFATLAGYYGDLKTIRLLEQHGIKCESNKAALLACAFNKKELMQYLISKGEINLNENYNLSHDYEASMARGRSFRQTETCELNLLSLVVANHYVDLAKLLILNKANLKPAYEILYKHFLQYTQCLSIKATWQELEAFYKKEIANQDTKLVSLIVNRNDGPLHKTLLANACSTVVDETMRNTI